MIKHDCHNTGIFAFCRKHLRTYQQVFSPPELTLKEMGVNITAGRLDCSFQTLGLTWLKMAPAWIWLCCGTTWLWPNHILPVPPPAGHMGTSYSWPSFPLTLLRHWTHTYTVKIVSKFTSFYRFIVLNLSFYRCRLPNLSFYPSIVLSFYRFLVRNIEFILSFYRFIVVNLSFYRCKPIVLSLRFIVLSL